MMGAAENLQHQIDTASFLKDPLQASLATLVAQIEEMVPELDQDKNDINSTQALLTEAEAAYRAKASALTGAKAKLTRAKNDMAHATLEEQRAASRAETARAVAGLSPRRDDPDGAGDPRSRRCPRHEGQGVERR
jgi:chromosome segregation ATPase